jgi:UDP-glucuronate 4-epimerase
MTNEKFFITGANGCIGSWVVRNLVRNGSTPAVLDHGGSKHRLELILSKNEISRLNFFPGDVSDLDSLEKSLCSSGATHVIHLAALQLPFCRVNPPLGATVNVLGTINIFEACKRAGIQKVVYASSMAVFGPKESYSEKVLSHQAPLKPQTHYGFFKQANEGNARVYWEEQGISSIGLRPFVIYGPGRDQGMTSTPTKAMIAASLGRPYMITFGGRFGFEFVDDAAKIFILAARTEFSGADTFNFGISFVSVPEIIAAIESVIPSARNIISFSEKTLPFPEAFDNSELVRLLGKLPETSLERGVVTTIETYQSALKDGRINSLTLENFLND